jgi:hypothetical protein
MPDFKLYALKGDEWVEERTFEFLRDLELECVYRLVAERQLKDIIINVNTEIPFDLAILNNLTDAVHIFTTEDIYKIDKLGKGQEKYFILRLKPEDTGDYKVTFGFDYLVK